ncbi:MAG: serine hydrolase domain-containing protein [Lysobacterales bacterium]
MQKLLFRCSLITCFQIFCLPAFAADPLLQMTADYETFFRQMVTDRNYPGAAFAIVSHDRVLHIVTVGHTTADRKRPIDQQTTFRLASVSKPFAAELVGLLVEDGILSWEDPVTRYVPDFKIDGDASQIRIRHLLGQSTGLIPHAYDNLLEDGKSMDNIWKSMSNLPYLCNPGSCYGYQNSVFSLVDPVVWKATSVNYETLIEQRIFKPLDMTNASMGLDAFINNPNHAKPHARRKGQWKTVPVQPNYYRAAPAAGVNASILDMSKWVQAQLGGSPAVLSPELISNLAKPRVETRREMHRKQWNTMLSEAHYGLGWRVYQLGDNQLIYHGGWVSGFRADVAFSLQHDIGIAVLLNVESSGISEMTTRFWQMALAP